MRKSPWDYDAIYRFLVERADLAFRPRRREIERDLLEVQARMDRLPRMLGIVRLKPRRGELFRPYPRQITTAR
jgi:hypothetical protein